MSKLKQYRMMRIKCGVYDEVKITECFATRAYEIFRGKKLEENELIEGIMKSMLPVKILDAEHRWKMGFVFKEKNYTGWFATTSGMKQEIKGIEKCETLFVTEEGRKFADYLEKLVSLDKFDNLKGQEISLNKKIYSRLSLAWSSSSVAMYIPNLIILPVALERLKGEYYTIKQNQETKAFSLDDLSLDEDVEMFDGGGIATPEVFEKIQKSMKVKYDLEFAIVRAYGIGVKGLISKFDIIKYLEKFHTENNDYCKKENDTFFLKDIYGEFRKVTRDTIILNETMVKLYDNFTNMQDYKDNIDKFKVDEAKLLNKLYVTKVNKNDEKLEEYKRLNYQLLTALAITKEELLELAKEDINYFKKIIRPFILNDKEMATEKYKVCVDNINHFFKNLATEIDEFEVDDEGNNIDTGKSLSTKIEEILSTNKDFVKLGYCKKQLARLTEKKVRELALGKITVKARVQYAAIDPIAFMNFAMYRDINKGNEILGSKDFYSYDCKNNDIRVIQRNPLMCASEVHKVRFVSNKFKQEWYSNCRELIYMPALSNIYSTMSGMDLDGDLVLTIDNDIISNSVVEVDKPFWNQTDGETKKIKYDENGIFLAHFEASSNLIGRLALKAAYINAVEFQTIRDYYMPAKNKWVTKKELIEVLNKIGITSEEDIKKEIEKKLKNKKLLRPYQVDIDIRKEKMKEQFRNKDFLKNIYTLLQVSQQAIDAPKTLIVPNLKEDLKALDEIYSDSRKVDFLYYDKDCEYNFNDQITTKSNNEKRDLKIQKDYIKTHSSISEYSRTIQLYLLNKIESNKIKRSYKYNMNMITDLLVNLDYDKTKISACIQEINNLFKTFNNKNNKLQVERKKYIEYAKSFEAETKCKKMKLTKKKAKALKEEVLKNIEFKYKEDREEVKIETLKIAMKIKEKYDLKTIATALTQVKFNSELFIIDFFFEVFMIINDKLQNTRDKLIEDENGDIRILYKNYRREKFKMISNSNVINKINVEDRVRYKLVKSANIRAKAIKEDAAKYIYEKINNDSEIILKVKIENDIIKLYKEEIELCEVFKDHTSLDAAQSLYDLKNEESIKVAVINLAKAGLKSKSFGLEVIEVC